MLAEEGPGLGCPLVNTVSGSKLASLKELRPGSAGDSEVRLLFVFDPQRWAVFLVGADKSGKWSDWYETAIARAEDAYQDSRQWPIYLRQARASDTCGTGSLPSHQPLTLALRTV